MLLVSVLIAILLGTMVVVGAVIFLGNWTSIRGKGICVLGLPQTGKTLFFNALRNRSYSITPPQTSVDKVQSFEITNEEGEIILKIRDTLDIGGGDAFAKKYYDRLIKDSDVVIFCCNIYKYFEDPLNAMDVRARLLYVYELMLKHKKITDINKPGENVRLLLTYADKIDDRKKATTTFIESLATEIYPLEFVENIVAVNMTDPKEVETVIKKMLCDE